VLAFARRLIELNTELVSAAPKASDVEPKPGPPGPDRAGAAMAEGAQGMAAMLMQGADSRSRPGMAGASRRRRLLADAAAPPRAELLRFVVIRADGPSSASSSSVSLSGISSSTDDGARDIVGRPEGMATGIGAGARGISAMRRAPPPPGAGPAAGCACRSITMNVCSSLALADSYASWKTPTICKCSGDTGRKHATHCGKHRWRGPERMELYPS
jgi:hypothetical protein